MSIIDTVTQWEGFDAPFGLPSDAAVAQWLGIASTPSLPTPAILEPPPAPITAKQMTSTWTPDMSEAVTQGKIQYQQQILRENNITGKSLDATVDPNGGISDWVVLAIGLGAVGAVYAFSRR